MRSKTIQCKYGGKVRVRKSYGLGFVGVNRGDRYSTWHVAIMTPEKLIEFGEACVQIGKELLAEKRKA